MENNHPAIIDANTFAQVQEELARRASKRKVKQIGTTTEQGKYCGKYALTELLVCGECGTHTADALGRQAVKRELCGAVSAALTTVKNTVTTHRPWKKSPYRKRL